MAQNYAATGDPNPVLAVFRDWDGAVVRICDAGDDTTGLSDHNAMAAVLNEGVGCTDETAIPPEEGNPLLTFVILLIVVGVLGAIAYQTVPILRRDTTEVGDDIGMALAPAVYDDVPDEMPESSETGGTIQATPVARFRTTYNRGHDTYDDSFSIETTDGEFLGECGAGIAESIGSSSPKSVAAVEVWLFDKNDIRTITKLVMSDYAFNDDGLKAKLATRGEHALAATGETIVLETASLIVNAEVTEIEYGPAEGELGSESYFERLTIELSAWAKDGDFEKPDIQARIDELDY
ncbi:MAG TPA: hypothetical protein VLL52_12510 [Anaerolineae bacterium]|nr:hypothetical protein [Anaerolineae bacterium]